MWSDNFKQPLLNQDGVISPRTAEKLGRKRADGKRWGEASKQQQDDVHDEKRNSFRRDSYLKSNGCAKDLNCGGNVCASRSEVDAAERIQDMKKLGRAVAFCVVFMIVEVVGGIKAGSLAILTDAAHLLSDVASFAISLFAIWSSGWEANLRQTYGFYRLEILGALVSIQIIWLITGIIVYEACQRIIKETVEINGRLMFIISSLGLMVNLVMMSLLDHGHSHGHSHGTGDSAHSHKDEHEHNHEHDHSGHDELDEDSHHHDDHSHDHGHENNHNENSQQQEQGDIHHRDSGREIVSCGQGAEVVLQQEGHKTECVRENITKTRRSTAGDTIIVCICDEIEESSPRNSGSNERSVRVTIDHGDHDHAHGGSHNINVRGAYLHVLGDLIQSVGVMIGGAVIWYNPAWKIVDLICTFFFSLVVLGTTIKLLRDILEVLMESTPRQVDAGALQKGLLEIEGVIAVHELHIWAITVGKVLLACHVMIEPNADADDVLQEVIQYCDKKYKISHVTIQIERYRH